MEIHGDLGRTLAIGEHLALYSSFHVVSPTLPALHVPVTLRVCPSLPMPPLTPPPSSLISTPSSLSSPVTALVTAMARKPPVSSFVGTAHPPVTPKHRTYPLVPCAHDFVASGVSNEPTKSSISAAVPHATTTESLPYISSVSSSIDAKICRNVHQHHCYLSNIRMQDFDQPKNRSEPNIVVVTQSSNLVISQPCAAMFSTPVQPKYRNGQMRESPALMYCD